MDTAVCHQMKLQEASWGARLLVKPAVSWDQATHVRATLGVAWALHGHCMSHIDVLGPDPSLDQQS